MDAFFNFFNSSTPGHDLRCFRCGASMGKIQFDSNIPPTYAIFYCQKCIPFPANKPGVIPINLQLTVSGNNTATTSTTNLPQNYSNSGQPEQEVPFDPTKKFTKAEINQLLDNMNQKRFTEKWNQFLDQNLL